RQSGRFPIWWVEAGDKASRNRVDAGGEDNRNGLRGPYHRPHGGCVAADQHDCDAATDEIDRQPGHPVIMALGPTILHGDLAALDEARFGQAAAKCGHVFRPFRRRHAVQDSDHWHRRLLCAGRERPRRRAAEQRDELASLHSITSSARASSVAGTSRPSARAVTRLMIRSNLVGCSTGKSAGLAPRKILSTYSAARR